MLRILENGADGRLTLSVHAPANARADIYIPKLVKGNFTLTESGKVPWSSGLAIQHPGVAAVQEEASFIKRLMGAGDHRFREVPSHSKFQL